ncbi:MAG: DNA recombination protein RmuC [Candidatus Vogelbacteria bacterium]|nr:DNA recombination protein RmuC [Candidatus Vogelbacteria bacterium]
MDSLYIILGLILGAIIGIFIFNIFSRYKKESGKDNSLILIQNQLNNLAKTLDYRLSESQKSVSDSVRSVNESVQSQLNQSFKIVSEITEKITRLDETNRQVVTFADQLQSLQDILKNPKQRGILGEYYLETLLKNVLPPESYEMQYKLGKDEDGKDLIPDAVVFVKDKIIPVDSKFSLENYNRVIEEKDSLEKERLEKLFVSDLKNRIVETSKYIVPANGTMDFAFMFIPHEAIYYDLIINKIGALKEDTESLIQRAASKYKVIIVSPTSFLAYLQTVLQGLKAMQIEDQAKDIVKRVGDLQTHLQKYMEQQDKLGRSINTVVNQYNDSSREFKKIDKDILRISDTPVALGYEPLVVDKPDLGE